VGFVVAGCEGALLKAIQGALLEVCVVCKNL